MNSIVTYLFKTKNQVKEVGWFRNALYVFIIYKALLYAVHFNELFSVSKLIYSKPKHTGFLNDLTYLLTNNYQVWLGALWIVIIAVLALIGLLKKSNKITNAMLWLLIININHYLYPTLTGGDYLLNQILFFNIFLSLKTFKNASINDISTSLHNTSLLALKIQVCLAYFLAGWFKVIDDSWLSGMAVYHIVQVPEYSNTLLSSMPLFICMIATYVTMLYQLLFPVLIWVRQAKIYVFAFGILQHLFIAFGMGLFSFGMVMIICYILFLKYDYSSTSLNNVVKFE